MGEAFLARGGGGGYTRLERMSATYGGTYDMEWKNLAVSTNIYFLQAQAIYTDDWSVQSRLEAFIEDGKVEVLNGDLSNFSISIGATSIKITTPYSNTDVDGTYTKLYRFC